jgi:hypothetical protein
MPITLSVRMAHVLTLNGYANLSTDPEAVWDMGDSDGTIPVNFDVLLYFDNVGRIEANDPVMLSDYNNNGRRFY